MESPNGNPHSLPANSQTHDMDSNHSSRSPSNSPTLDPMLDDKGSVTDTFSEIEPMMALLRASSFGQREKPADSIRYKNRLSSTNGERTLPIKAADLPYEIILSVLHYLSSPTDLLATLRTCRSWCVCSVDILWYKPSVEKPASLARLINTLRLDSPSFTYAAFIRRLSLSAVHDIVTDAVICRFSGCTRLERLTLVGCSRVTNESLIQLIEANPHLIALDFSGLSLITDAVLQRIASCCPLVTGINLTGCKLITDIGVSSLSVACPNLRRFKLTHCDLVTDAGVGSIIKNCQLLLELDVNFVPGISDASIASFAKDLPTLRELRLQLCTGITSASFLPTFQAASLRIIDLTACTAIDNDALAVIVRMAPRIRNLVVSRCRAITDLGIIHIASLGRYLHYLHLGHCDQLTDMAIAVLCKYCPRLRYLDLACVSLLTDAAIIEIAQLPKLRRIGLVKCQNLSDLAVFALVGKKIINDAYVSPLERVHLSFCINLTLHGVLELLNTSPRLTHLSLTGVPSFLREDLRRYSRPAPVDFSAHQANLFCVFSGSGVGKLRSHLNYLMHQVRLNQAQIQFPHERDNYDTRANLWDQHQYQQPQLAGTANGAVVHENVVQENGGQLSTALRSSLPVTFNAANQEISVNGRAQERSNLVPDTMEIQDSDTRDLLERDESEDE